MKRSELKLELKKHITEILSEEAYEVKGATDKTVTSFKTPTDATKFKAENPNIKSIKKLEEDELDEMARQEKFFAIGNEELANQLKDRYKDKWTGKIISAVMDAGEGGTTQPALAKFFNVQQPAINGIFRKLTDDGVFTIISGDGPTGKPHASHKSRTAPTEKPSTTPTSSEPSDDADVDIKDTWGKEDADDKPSVEKEPSKSDLSKPLDSKIASASQKYSDLIKKMKDIASKYKDEKDSSEAQKYVDQLKDLTKEKKNLEKIINPSIEDDDEE